MGPYNWLKVRNIVHAPNTSILNTGISTQHNTERKSIDTKDQLENIFTKPHPKETFENFEISSKGLIEKTLTLLIVKQWIVSLNKKRGFEANPRKYWFMF